MTATRRRDVTVVGEAVPQPGMVEIFMKRHKDSLELLAPVVGAAVGAMALEAASQHVGMKRHEIGLVGAGLAFLAGANAQGAMRQLAMGVAAGAACYGMVEVLREGHPDWLYTKQQQQQQQQRQAAPSDALTHAELDRALAELGRRHQADLAARESAHAQAMREMKHSYEAQLGEMQSAVHALLNELRRERGEPVVEYPATPIAVDAAQPAAIPDEATHPAASNDNASPKTAPAIAPSRSSLTPEQTSHFAAIYGLLAAEERVRVSAMIAGASPTLLATVQHDLLSMTPERAVAHLRRNIFPSGAAA